MPIRLNLLAEAQAAEDLRRRDPVKRALWLARLMSEDRRLELINEAQEA